MGNSIQCHGGFCPSRLAFQFLIGGVPSVLPFLRVVRRGTQPSQQSTRALADPLLIPPEPIKSSLSTLRRQHGPARTTETPRYNLGSRCGGPRRAKLEEIVLQFLPIARCQRAWQQITTPHCTRAQ